MRMTKQHFEYIAWMLKAMRTCLVRYSNAIAISQFEGYFVPMIADDLAKSNPAFNKQRFIKACGVSDD